MFTQTVNNLKQNWNNPFQFKPTTQFFNLLINTIIKKLLTAHNHVSCSLQTLFCVQKISYMHVLTCGQWGKYVEFM